MKEFLEHMEDRPIRLMMVIGRLGDGGKERQLLLLLKTLKAHKDIFTLLVTMNAGGEREKEAEQVVDNLVIFPNRKKTDFIQPFKKIIKLINTNQINILHTWGSGVWDLMGVLAGRKGHISVLHNGIRSAPKRLNLYNHLTRLSALYADVVAANSQAGLNSFRLARHSNAKVIYNGLDQSRFEKIDIQNEGFHLCMVANFQERKDHESLVLAMPDILKYFPKTRLTLIGHDYGTLQTVQALVDELQFSEKVKFITDCTQPEPIIGKCQIGILATNDSVHGEGISNAILEYMALSRPVIASRNGGNPEIVMDNKTGFLVQPGSHKEISEKVIYLFNNQVIARNMGENGKTFVTDRFSMKKMETNYINTYKKLLVIDHS